MNSMFSSLLSLFFVAFVAAQVTSPPAPQLIAGDGRNALEFQYSNYVELPGALSERLGNDFTFETWIQVYQADTRNEPNPGDWGSSTPGYTQLNRPIVSRYNGTGYNPSDPNSNPPRNVDADFNLQVLPEGQVALTLGSRSTSYGVTLVSRNKLESYRWYHIAFSIQYAAGQTDWPSRVNLYIDGWSTGIRKTDDVSQNWVTGARRNPLNTMPILLGKYQNEDPNWRYGQYFVGKMDEVRFWDNVRSRSQIYSDSSVLTNLTVADGQESWAAGVAAAYNFNSESGDQLVDQSGHQFHGKMYPGRFNVAPTWLPSELAITAFFTISVPFPALVRLPVTRPYDTLAQYSITFSNMSGSFYEWTGVYLEPTMYPGAPAGIKLPEAGAPVFSGGASNTENLVFVPSFDAMTGTYSFTFQAVSTQTSNVTSFDSPIVLQVFTCDQGADVFDYCGVCNGNNATLNECGSCIGDLSCLGCDGVPNSGAEPDTCGVCRGQNLCFTCDGMGGVVDACGVCGGRNTTCGGCDGQGGQYDECGVCKGKGESCTCKVYHGYHIEEMDYLMIQWTMEQIIKNIDAILNQNGLTLHKLKSYEDDFDFGTVVKYINEFLADELIPNDPHDVSLDPNYMEIVEELKHALDISLGLKVNEDWIYMKP